MAEEKAPPGKTLYVVFSAGGGRFTEVKRVEANSAGQAIKSVAEGYTSAQNAEPLILAATPARSWTVMEITRVVQPRFVFTEVGGAAAPEAPVEDGA